MQCSACHVDILEGERSYGLTVGENNYTFRSDEVEFWDAVFCVVCVDHLMMEYYRGDGSQVTWRF
jgi:ferredoxin